MKTCIACGMPMTQSAHFPNGDAEKDYCIYCARPDGDMQSYEEKWNSTTDFLVRTQGLDRTVAQKTATQLMAKLPAWVNHEQAL